MANSVTAAVPAWLDGCSINASQLRREIAGAIYPQAGIVDGLAAAALPTPAMKVRLPAGLSLVDDSNGGFYTLWNTTQTDLDIAASDAVSPRYDSLIAQVLDNGDATSTYVYRIVTGTPASSPTPPTLPPADAPGALCERIANVYVQANAETNGFVRSGDVPVVAPSARLVPRPTSKDQIGSISGTAFATLSTWVDFTSGQWPPLSFVVPPSGSVYVTMSANVASNTGSSTSSLWAGWRGTGGGIASGTASAVMDPRGVEAYGGARTYASKRRLVTGLTPGSTVTLTPAWWCSSQNAGTRIGESELIVEPVA